jgi:hypothetical protein
MHGLIHSELKRFTETVYGPEVWKQVLGSVRLEYRSSRRMVAVARGIIQGVADFSGDVVEISERELVDGTELLVAKVA